jgi:DNA-binding response OmpR family regulator/anti-sigma regulatory factor (Ser/Thr protein kinase)
VEEEKIRFFTNISHDLKTPLTLVVAPLEKIRQTSLPAPIRTEVDVAWRNARQLNDLVMELLDFRRLDVGMEKLHLKRGDIVSFVRQTAQGFSYYATPKQVELILDLPQQPIEINFDENKMRRIITNLLSNAYKYNIDNGTVTVNLKVDGQQMALSVADTGIGVNDKQHIFDRFVQETHGQEQEGSGLGLHIVRQYAGMMGGSVSVTDNVPQGSIFTVTLPVSLNAIDAEAETDENTEAAIADADTSAKPTILVVEDNLDSRQFLKRSLDDEYNIVTAANGKEALRELGQHSEVKLILTDVMMPEMDGIELFRHIRNNINYSHIPVILLTAKSGEENIISGLKEGAADYITKPYSLEVLRLRIKKIMQWTENAYNQVGKGFDISPSEITVSSLDEELVSRVMESIEANMQNPSYSVVQLSNDVNMTRGHLYKKLMAITGKSPLEFIRIVKIKRGKSLLDQGRRNVSEVADRVGLSPKQFSYYFKNIYGETPSEYLKNNK